MSDYGDNLYTRSRKPMSRSTALIRLILAPILFFGFAIYAALQGTSWPLSTFVYFAFLYSLSLYAFFKN